jgi:hypothetical protein
MGNTFIDASESAVRGEAHRQKRIIRVEGAQSAPPRSTGDSAFQVAVRQDSIEGARRFSRRIVMPGRSTAAEVIRRADTCQISTTRARYGEAKRKSGKCYHDVCFECSTGGPGNPRPWIHRCAPRVSGAGCPPGRRRPLTWLPCRIRGTGRAWRGGRPPHHCTRLIDVLVIVALYPPTLLLHSWPSIVPRKKRVAPAGTTICC